MVYGWEVRRQGGKSFHVRLLASEHVDRTMIPEELPAAADKLDNFHFVAISQANLGPFRPRNNVAISLDGDAVCLQLHEFD